MDERTWLMNLRHTQQWAAYRRGRGWNSPADQGTDHRPEEGRHGVYCHGTARLVSKKYRLMG